MPKKKKGPNQQRQFTGQESGHQETQNVREEQTAQSARQHRPQQSQQGAQDTSGADYETFMTSYGDQGSRQGNPQQRYQQQHQQQQMPHQQHQQRYHQQQPQHQQQQYQQQPQYQQPHQQQQPQHQQQYQQPHQQQQPQHQQQYRQQSQQQQHQKQYQQQYQQQPHQQQQYQQQQPQHQQQYQQPHQQQQHQQQYRQQYQQQQQQKQPFPTTQPQEKIQQQSAWKKDEPPRGAEGGSIQRQGRPQELMTFQQEPQHQQSFTDRKPQTPAGRGQQYSFGDTTEVSRQAALVKTPEPPKPQTPREQEKPKSQMESQLVKETEQMKISTPVSSEPQPVSESQPIPSGKTGRIVSQKARFVNLNVNFNINPTLMRKFLPDRPDDGGRKGYSIALTINCLDMKIKPMKIYMYDIELTKAEVVGSDQKKRDVTVKMKKKDTLRNIVMAFLKGNEGLPVFDGGRIIFNNRLLSLPNMDGINKITFDYKLDGDNVKCHFTIQRVKEEDIELNSINTYIAGRGRSDDMPHEALRALDTTMKEMFLNKNLINIGGRAIFDIRTAQPLRCGPYILVEGYSTTIRPHMWKVRFNFDKTQVVCHEAINLLEYISKIINIDRGFNAHMLTKKLKTLRVQASHLKNAEGKQYDRKYTIFGFSKKNAIEEKIEEKKMTIQQYFLKEYNIKLKRPDLPMVKTSPTRPTYVPIELLTLLPYQKVLDTDGKIIQEVIKFAAIPCFQRLDLLRKAVSNLKLCDQSDKFLNNYMIQIDPNLINLNGRVIEGPEAFFGGRKEFLRSGKWDIRNKKFVKPYDKPVNWALFGVGTERDYQRNEQPLFEVEEKLPRAAGNVGINMNPSFHFEYVNNQSIEKVVTEIIKRSEKERKKLDLLVFVVNSDDDYRSVKRFGDMNYGIVTQCMKYSNLSRQRGLDQYLGNIMLKINGKLGGTNWELTALKNCQFSPIKESFMVFGIDVTHPGATRNDLSKSIAAMVGSLDNIASMYSAIIRQQISKKEKAIVEIVLNMEDMVHELLLTFYKMNKQLKPKHLIFYRDGVSEGQFEIVFKHEIIAIQNACQKLDKNYQPPITYIVVQKRHKIRFFPKDQKDAVGKSGNVPAGTVVDKDITHCREFDFYLCSHDGIQGTSKPAHYHVLFDENNWGSDDLQSFTYFLCHMYARCTRSVSYPAPTYYAHLAAFRGRALIGQLDDDSSSVSSGHSAHIDPGESRIRINEFHNDKLFFI